jgi:hypothetical protein
MSKHIYTTAQGKQIDIEGLRVANEETIAVGNMKVNARGDKLGAGGRVAETRNQTQDAYYRLNTQVPQEISNPDSEVAVRQQARSGAKVTQGTPMPETLTEVPTVEDTQEEIVSPTTPEDPVPQLRGSLASAMASPKVHKQELIKDPRKPIGPARI